ncbi:MAG: hypothetical protein ACE5LD_02750 [Candidatus Bipolaricaulia bacterium]
MRIEVDSSGIWGNQAEPTVFAFSNSLKWAIWIAPEVKRVCIQEVRRQKGRTTINDYVRLYAISVFLLLRDPLGQMSEIVLDLELQKKMGTVRSIAIELTCDIDPQLARTPIRVRRIGKTSRAHDLANAVYRGERSPDRRIRADEILSLF